MSEVIERVAKAIEDTLSGGDSFVVAAYEAIKAMREPSEAMVLESARASVDQHHYKINTWERYIREGDRQDWLNGAKYGWYAAIDIALGFEPPSCYDDQRHTEVLARLAK